MPSEGRGILSPVRLPVPPLQPRCDGASLFEYSKESVGTHSLVARGSVSALNRERQGLWKNAGAGDKALIAPSLAVVVP